MKTLSQPVRRGAGLAALAALLGGCAVGPEFTRPAPPNVDRYTTRPLPEATVVADGREQRFRPGAAVPADWWRLFQSAPLDALLREALAHNPTVQAAEASLRQSQDRLRAGQGVFYPQAAAGLDARRERADANSAGSAAHAGIFNLVTLTGTVTYTLDVFGGERRAVEGLQAQVDYQYFESQAAYLTMTANVVDTCIARAAYAAEIRATRQLLDLQVEQLRAVEAQVRAGTAPYVNALSLRSLIAANQASLAPLAQRLSAAEHLLAALLGQTPGEAALPDIDLDTLVLPADLPVTVPSDLVRQRPDVLAAEAQMRAASANIGVATAAMLPSFSLTGTYGVAGSGFTELGSAGGRFWSVGPSATIPLFQGGSLWFGRKAAIDAYQLTQAVYRTTVLAAFEQVADALQAVAHDAEALQAQAESRQNAAEALRLVQANFQAGLVADVDVLAADGQFHAAAVAYWQAVAQRHQDTVALFAALGGGWTARPAPVAGDPKP